MDWPMAIFVLACAFISSMCYAISGYVFSYFLAALLVIFYPMINQKEDILITRVTWFPLAAYISRHLTSSFDSVVDDPFKSLVNCICFGFVAGGAIEYYKKVAGALEKAAEWVRRMGR